MRCWDELNRRLPWYLFSRRVWVERRWGNSSRPTLKDPLRPPGTRDRTPAVCAGAAAANASGRLHHVTSRICKLCWIKTISMTPRTSIFLVMKTFTSTDTEISNTTYYMSQFMYFRPVYMPRLKQCPCTFIPVHAAMPDVYKVHVCFHGIWIRPLSLTNNSCLSGTTSWVSAAIFSHLALSIDRFSFGCRCVPLWLMFKIVVCSLLLIYYLLNDCRNML